MNTQELFNTVVKHLLTQNEKSIDLADNRCLYYNPVTKLKCAIGCLIAPCHYNEHFENLRFSSRPGTVIRTAVEDSIGRELLEEECYFLRSLQEIHDNHTPNDWPELLAEEAVCYSLTMPSI